MGSPRPKVHECRHARRLGPAAVLLATAAATAGCSLLLPTEDELSGGGGNGLQCQPGQGDCNDDPGDGCETDLTNNAEHCGGCGISCRGQPCSGSKCPPVHLFSGSSLRDLAVDDESVYWLNGQGQVTRGDKLGTSFHALCDPQSSSVVNGRLVLDDAFVYWTADDSQGSPMVLEVGKDGGTPTVLATDGAEDIYQGIAEADDWVYWTQSSYFGAVFRVSKHAGGTTETLWEAPSEFGVYDVAVTGTSAYFTTPQYLYGVPIEGSPASDLADMGGPGRLVARDGWIFVSDEGGNRVRRMTAGGGSLDVLASDQPVPRGIATDGTHVYWTNRGEIDASNGTINELALDEPGATIVVLADGQDEPGEIAVDDRYVYWINAGADQLMVVPK